MRVRPEIVSTACFIGLEADSGLILPRCSAFYVVVPYLHNRAIGRGYLVTARHNVEMAKGRRLYASINVQITQDRTNPEWHLIEASRWFVDDDNAIDVAIADWRPDYSNSYYGVLTDNFIEGPPETGPIFELMQGMETATIGLFPYHSGRLTHTPIVRSGNIAALPVDPVITGRGLAHAYLIEARSVGGLSGSPVFVGEDTYHGLKRQPLLGLVHGHFDWKDETMVPALQPIQTGIAVVTPSSAILKILRHPDCAATRANFNCLF